MSAIELPAAVSQVHFIKLDLHDAQGKLISSNFYWHALPEHPDDLTTLNDLPAVTLEGKATRSIVAGRETVTVSVHNPTAHIALMAHLQLRRAHSGDRVLPVLASDNYISLLPNETRTITLDAAAAQFKGEEAQVVIDGWNVTVTPNSAPGVSIAPNVDAQPDHWPTTNLPYQTVGLR